MGEQEDRERYNEERRQEMETPGPYEPDYTTLMHDMMAMTKERDSLQGKLVNAFAANNALGSEKDRDEVMTRLVKEGDEWKRKAEDCENRAGVLKMDPILALQNRDLRRELDLQFIPCRKDCPCSSCKSSRAALALPPTATEKRVVAMGKVCEAVDHLEPSQFTSALEDAWEELQEAQKV